MGNEVVQLHRPNLLLPSPEFEVDDSLTDVLVLKAILENVEEVLEDHLKGLPGGEYIVHHKENVGRIEIIQLPGGL